MLVEILRRPAAILLSMFWCSTLKIEEWIKNKLSTKPEERSAHFFRHVWKPFILHKACKVVTLALVVVSAGLFFVALYDMELGLDQQLPVLEHGNLYNFFGDVKRYIEMGPVGSLIIQNADYEDAQTIKVLDDLIELISRRKGLTSPPWRAWYKGVLALKDNTLTIPQIRLTCFPGVDPYEIIKDFEELTDYFLTMNLAHPCCKEFGICGGQFYEDIERKSVVLTEENHQLENQLLPQPPSISRRLHLRHSGNPRHCQPLPDDPSLLAPSTRDLPILPFLRLFRAIHNHQRDNSPELRGFAADFAGVGVSEFNRCFSTGSCPLSWSLSWRCLQ